MTEAQLLQLLADVRLVLRAQAKPVPYTTLNDALAGTASSAHTRLTLRVLDVLVATGELTRHIDANGGRNTYEHTSRDSKDSGRALLKAFEYDLDGSSREPAAAPASTSLKSEAPQGRAPRKIAIAPPPPRAAEPANADAVPLFMPGNSVRMRVLTLIESQPTVTRHQLRQALRDIIKASLDNALLKLKTEGLIATVAPGEYRRCSADPKPAVAPPAVKESLTVATAAPATAPAFDGPAQGFHRPDDPLDQAFDALRQRIERQALTIADLDLKVRTLNRLGELLDPDILSVLDAIANDLQQVAA